MSKKRGYAAALAAVIGSFRPSGRSTPAPPPHLNPAVIEAKRAARRGLKRFEIDGKVIYAINKKNAIRKAART